MTPGTRAIVAALRLIGGIFYGFGTALQLIGGLPLDIAEVLEQRSYHRSR